ncbi:hypothetical protein ACIPSJ_22765 [Streptomyces sp. NPDC090088]|uniref:hypothetical protein n=1 Tax=Streptomyces sp. NPDC090088 TaxID=3365944 RepID=UPI0038088715
MPVPTSVLILTSAEPSSSVRSVACESTAMILSALSTAEVAVFTPPEPHADTTTIAAAVNPTHAAVYFSFMSPHPSL